jgi:tetratricopeptide (TPR) repeat protein
MHMQGFVKSLFAAALLVWSAISHGAAADVQRLVAEGKLQEALARVDADLAADSADVTLQFLKGLVLTRLNRLDQAAGVFQRITEQHPELPEPYNNLAVVHAARGDFEAAQQALQKAINTHPSYATAHENLGDIYAKMASRAYNQALQLDEGNSSAKAKLALIDNLFSMPDLPVSATAGMPVAATGAPKPSPPPERHDGVEQTPVSRDAVEAGRPVSPLSAPVVAESTVAAPATEAAEGAAQPAAPPPPSSADEIRSAVDAWAAAWSAQSLDEYLDAYSEEFTPQDGVSRAEWEQTRRDRVARPGYIRVTMSGMKIIEHGPDHAQVKFLQRYESDAFTDTVSKTLMMKKSDHGWKIVAETLR